MFMQVYTIRMFYFLFIYFGDQWVFLWCDMDFQE
jgi:hypothetical protein